MTINERIQQGGIETPSSPCFLDVVRSYPERASHVRDPIARLLGRDQPNCFTALDAEHRAIVDADDISCAWSLLSDEPRALPSHVCIQTAHDTVSRYARAHDVPDPQGLLPLALSEPEGDSWAAFVTSRSTPTGTVTLFGNIERWSPWRRDVYSYDPTLDPGSDEWLEALDDPLDPLLEPPPGFRFIGCHIRAKGSGSRVWDLASQLETWFQKTLLGEVIGRRGRPRMDRERHRDEFWSALDRLRREGTAWTEENVAEMLDLPVDTLQTRRKARVYPSRHEWITFFEERGPAEFS